MNERLQTAIRMAEASIRGKAEMNRGIGTQSERMLHAVLKYYFEPDEAKQEVRIGRNIADIYRPEDNRILEIQTRDFGRLRGKLDAFLPQFKVTVVHPVPREKHLYWLNPDSGEMTGGSRSPKKGTAFDMLAEIYQLPDHQMHPNLSFLPVMMDVNEYRLADGYSRDGKRGSHRMERMPYALEEGFLLENSEDYRALLREGPYGDILAEPFTSKDFARAVKLRGRAVSEALKVLERAGAVQKTGIGKNRSYIYERVND